MVVWAAGGCGPQQQCTVPKCLSLTYFVCRLPPPMRGTSASTWPAGQGNKAIVYIAPTRFQLLEAPHSRRKSMHEYLALYERHTLCACVSPMNALASSLHRFHGSSAFGVCFRHACMFAWGTVPGVDFSARAPRQSARKTLPPLQSPGRPHPNLAPRYLLRKDRFDALRHRHRTLLAGPSCRGGKR